MKLFEKVPANFFSLLTRKYRSVYAFALLTLFDALKIYKTKIKRSDYVMMLRNRGGELLALFDENEDQSEDGIQATKEEVVSTDDTGLTKKINHIIRKMAETGWIDVEKDPRQPVWYIYLPTYTIYSLDLIRNICSDDSSYVPLVHQTYSELKLEDEKEDELMFRSLLNAEKNAESLDLYVCLLHHSICVYSHRLNTMLSPNDILEEHFDSYGTEVIDEIYHPMKTYDSLGLYALPIVTILRKWLYDDAIIKKLVVQSHVEPSFRGYSEEERIAYITKTINKVIDTFSQLNKVFKDIDDENSNYVEAVQKRIRYLSNNDKTTRGKLEAIILSIAKEYNENDGDIELCRTLEEAGDSCVLMRSTILNGESLTMPFKKKYYEETDPLMMEEAYSPEDGALTKYLEEEVSGFGAAAVNRFMINSFKGNKEITTEQIEVKDYDDLTLLILGLIAAQFDDSPVSLNRFDGEEVQNASFRLPKYKLNRKEMEEK